MKHNANSLIRPAQYVERELLTSIFNGKYPPGTVLPNERGLAAQMGVTRPTLRETLQRLSGEGWIKIRQGKPTVVNDYWKNGGLRLLATMAKYSDFLPNGFITHLLEVRCTLLPIIARLSAEKAAEVLLKYLAMADSLNDEATGFATYDWKLQLLMAEHSCNPIYTLIFNDFTSAFMAMAFHYFSLNKSRKTSRKYYIDLIHAIHKGSKDVEETVRKAMENSIVIWNEVKTIQGKT
ncbi:MAG: GntR family transcriptional regulator [Thermodesulfobacteriota bacterium]|nr:GntR family transcriptional regulator [Thermodesulfobacteriota bacterium]